MTGACGTTSGYDRHSRDKTTPCDECRAAAAEYEYRRRIDGLLGKSRTSHSEGTARRIRALVALGYTFGQIGSALDRSQDWAAKLAHREDSIVRAGTAAKVDALYRAWCMKRPDETTGRQRWAASYARSTARKNGWSPPLAWDNIDDPNEHPSLGGADDQIDPVVVERLLLHQRVPSTRAEKVEAMRQWLASGRSQASFCTIHGWQQGRYVERQDGAA